MRAHGFSGVEIGNKALESRGAKAQNLVIRWFHFPEEIRYTADIYENELGNCLCRVL